MCLDRSLAGNKIAFRLFSGAHTLLVAEFDWMIAALVLNECLYYLGCTNASWNVSVCANVMTSAIPLTHYCESTEQALNLGNTYGKAPLPFDHFKNIISQISTSQSNNEKTALAQKKKKLNRQPPIGIHTPQWNFSTTFVMIHTRKSYHSIFVNQFSSLA